MASGDDVPLDIRISGALNQILMIYNIPEEIRKIKIENVLATDYRNIGRRILKEFIEYIEDVNDKAFEELILKRKTNK